MKNTLLLFLFCMRNGIIEKLSNLLDIAQLINKWQRWIPNQVNPGAV